MFKEISERTTQEITDRAWVLWEHEHNMMTNETYFTKIVTGQIPDPLDDEDYDPDDPWYSYWKLEDELRGRGNS